MSKAAKTRRVLIIPDVHAPNHDGRAVEAMLGYASKHKYDEVVCLGDFIDLDSLSRHNKGRPRKQEGQRLAADLASAASLWAEVVTATPGATRTVLGGNHEDRLERYLDEHPELDGALVELEDLFVSASYTPYKKHSTQYRVGKLHFTHGSYCGSGAVRRHLNEYGVNLVIGHLHRLEIVTRPSNSGTMLAACLGYLGKPELGHGYLDGPNNWTSGFGEAFVAPDGSFSLLSHVIVKGRVLSSVA